jgi:acetolactate synthase-1/2/3 large subunit
MQRERWEERMSVVATKRKPILGGEVISRILAAEGVEKVFGIIDGTYFGFYSTLEANGIDLVSPRHEASAAYMAGAYARTTGKLGVCMASNGPGVANVLPGVAVEQAEGNRVLLITSSRREGIIYPDRGGTYQYFPQVEVTHPMTKWSCAVPSVDRLAEVLRRALRTSYNRRPGVVHVDVPESILNGRFEADPGWFRSPGTYRALEPLAPAATQIEEAARLLRQARLPLLHAGSGVVHAGAYEELAELADLLEAPVTTSWGARAAVDERRRHALPMIHLDVVNRARRRADLILVLGSRLGETDYWGKPPYWGAPGAQKAIQVDVDPDALGNTRAVDLAVQADVKLFLRRLLEALRGEVPANREGRRAWLDDLRRECRASRARLDRHLEDPGIPMASAHVARVCREIFDDDAILVIDGGNAAVWSHFFHEVRVPGTVLGTPKMGMLGAGVAQALGAKVAHPDRQVYCIIGDGAMGFSLQEIETAVRNRLPVVILVLCDRQWGMVKMNQQFALKPLKTLVLKSLGPEETINADLGEIEFDQVARAMGAHGERVSDPGGLRGAIERSLASGRCAVIHVDVDPVKHMWAPGLKAFKDMHEEPQA